jgi:hypothetical protein
MLVAREQRDVAILLAIALELLLAGRLARQVDRRQRPPR